ncbi:hypothetical protein GF412_00810 [Candidatus Micrarchaeota archaeon]|nr:hypothetical protein [Candidatus Micrarchaeota archaeon]MBD3417514.1 hypothetical protein [Candidatus Micrarchaeota archaeon]
MEEITKSLIFAFLLIAILYAFGAIAYHNLEHWRWVDSIYFMTATFTTVGYGDFVPSTDEGKIFTVFFMWTGISIGFYLIYTISKYREEKIDHRLFPFVAHIMDRGSKKEKKKKYYSEMSPEEIPRDIRQIINPARPSAKRKRTKK